MWNSNLPKPNAIYVYGVANANITFFKRSDILSYETREVLLKYFDTLDKDEESLKNALKDLENPFGFAPYIRKAYEHKKEFSNHHQIESFFSCNHILRAECLGIFENAHSLAYLPIYLFLVEYEFIFSVKKLTISLIEKAPYIPYPLALYEKIEQPHTLLFESADVESKVHTKSLLMAKACLKLICNHNIFLGV
ncbi:hypothetical protein BD0138_01140 [Helicobacter pylori]